MKTKNKNLLYFTLIFAFILAFCGALVLSVYTAEKVAFAEAPQNNTFLWAEGNFNQVIESDDGLHYEWDDNMPYPNITVTSQYCLSAYGDTLYPSCTITPYHTYCLRFSYFNPYNQTGTIVVRFPDMINNQVMISLTQGVYSNIVLLIYNDYNSESLYSQLSLFSQVPFGFSDLELIDITNLSYYYNSSYYNSSYPITDLQSYFYYFGTVYHPYAYDVDISEAKYYGIEGAFDVGYDDGWDRGYNEGYSTGSNEGYTSGYNTGYDTGYDAGYDVGYDTGYVKGINGFLDYSYICSETDFVSSPPYPLFENVRDNYWAIYGITDDEAYLSLSVGYLDIFNLSFEDLSRSYPSFSWYLPTASVKNGVITYGFNTYTSLYFGYDSDLGLNTLFFSDSDDPSDPYSNYNIYIEMQAHHTLIHTSFFVPEAVNSGAVPNFYDGFGIDIYALKFSLTNTNYDSFLKGYNSGITYADNRVNGSSASYAAGYNYGVDSVGNFTFPSIISAAIDIPVQTARSLLNFDFFGTNLNSFVLSLLSFGIVVAVIKLLLGR